MITKAKLITIFLLFSKCIFSQDVIDVTEQTIKVNGMNEETLYFGFAKGDKIIFSYNELNEKELKEVEILEYPNNSKFSDYKSSKIENKSINVTNTSVYLFRFKNTAISGRIIKIKIQRIPINEETKQFNSTVTWITKQDTTWNSYTKDVIIGYDTAFVKKSRKELIKIDTLINLLSDKVHRVHSETAIGKSQYTYASIELPKNTYLPNLFYPYETTEVVAWSYWLGVGQKAKEDYENANKNMSKGISVIGSLTGYGALATLVTTGISFFSNTSLGDNVRYKFYGIQNGQEITIDYGNVVSAAGRNDKIKQGSFSVELYNDNFRDGIDVSLKMVVMQVKKTWKDIEYIDQIVTAKKEKKIFSDPIITSKKIPTAKQN